MPQLIALPVASFFFTLGAPLAVVNTIAGVGVAGSVFGAVASVGIGLGVSYLSSAIFGGGGAARQIPSTDPTDVQQSIRSATADRYVFYGQYRASGSWVFAETKQGAFHRVIYICEGPLVTLLGITVDGNEVVRTGTGFVPAEPYDNKVRVQIKYGLPTETVYSSLTSAFSEWTSAHRGDGCVSLYATQYATRQEKYYSTFPSGVNTLYRITGKFTKITNISTEAVEWSDNAAGVIRHFMGSENGMRIPDIVLDTDLASAVWLRSWNRAAEAFNLKGGGSEARYRLWGAYKLSESPGNVLDDMLRNCDGRPILTRDGGLAVDIGEFYEPTVLLDDEVVTGFARLKRGNDVTESANKITSKYLSADSDYQLVDADPWIDDDSVSARGEIPVDIPLNWTPSHSQARRLMKLQYHRINPEWIITLNCRLEALAAFQEQFVSVDYSIGGTRIYGVFETEGFEFNFGANGILQSVSISLRSITSAAYAWDEDQEEGSAPVYDEVEVDNTIPEVAGFGVTVDRRTIGGTVVPYAVLDFDDPGEALIVELRGKKTSESNWTNINVPEDATSVDGFIMDDGVEYEFQARHVTLTGRTGDWSDSIDITPTADETAPDDPTSVSGVGGVGEATIYWTSPNSANFSRCAVYRNTSNTETGATLVGRFYGSATTAYSTVDGGLAAGTYYYFVTAENYSGVASDPAIGTGAVTVT